MLNLHSMAVPSMTPIRALEHAQQLGFAGLELIIDDDYPCAISVGSTRSEITELQRAAADHGSGFAALSSYERRLGSTSVSTRVAATDRVLRELELTARLGAGGLRVLAGNVSSAAVAAVGGGSQREDDFAIGALIDSLGRASEQAESLGVRVLLENHMDSYADTVHSTLELVEAVAHPSLAILADPANLELVTPGGTSENLAAQLPLVRHLHLKDFRRGDSIAARTPVTPGDGEMDWAAILDAFAETEAEVSVTFEYEARWFELPPVADIAALVLGRFEQWCEVGEVQPREVREVRGARR